MAYTKQTWVDGQSPLNAERMNHIEDGVLELSEEKLDKGSPAAHQQMVTDASGAAAWEDRTHYGDIQTITWDGNTDGLIQAGSGVYKVSDLAPSSQYISEGKFGFTASKSSITYRSLMRFGSTYGDSYAISFQGTTVYVIDEAPATIEGATYPEAGTYFHNNRGSYLTSLSWGELKQLDEKYIPDNVPVIQTATVGQTIAVKAVDENGKPTEWEAVDGGSGGITVYQTEGIYLYHFDVETGSLSEKVTREEFIKAANSGPVYLGYMASDGSFNFNIPRNLWCSSTLGRIDTYTDDSYFTAEYIMDGPN